MKYSWSSYLEVSALHGLSDAVNAGHSHVKISWIIVLLAAFSYCFVETIRVVVSYSRGEVSTTIDVSKLSQLPLDLSVCYKNATPVDEKDNYGWLWDYEKLFSEVGSYGDAGTIWWEIFKLGNDYEVAAEAGRHELVTDLAHMNSSKPGQVDERFMPNIYQTVMSHEFESMLIDLSLKPVKITNLVYKQSGEDDKRNPPSADYKLSIDRIDGGICQLFDWRNYKIPPNSRYVLRTKAMKCCFRCPCENSLKVLIGDNQVFNYRSFEIDFVYKVSVMVTKFRRIKQCSSFSRVEQQIQINQCRNQLLYKAFDCCVCIGVGSQCPSPSRCCLTEHFDNVAFHNSAFVKLWGECGKVIPPCVETSYTATVTGHQYLDRCGQRNTEVEDWRDEHIHPDSGTDIEIFMANPQAVTEIIEVPAMSVEQFLGNVGGVIGLFAGGSLLSIIQMAIHSMGWVAQRFSPFAYKSEDEDDEDLGGKKEHSEGQSVY